MDDKSDLLNTLRIDRSVVPRRRLPKWAAYAVGLLLAVTLAVFAWWFFHEPAPTVRVAMARPLPGSSGPAASAALLDATGYVVARRQATVGPKIAGKLHDVLVEEGMHVEVGQPIAHLDDSNALVALNQAKATLDQAETAAADARPVFERSQAQVARELISREAFDTAKANFDATWTAAAVARAALAVARQNLDDTVVLAPFTGVVTVKAAQAGEIISPLSAGAGFTRTGIATIVDMDSLEVDVDVSENFINRVRAEQRCAVTLNAYSDWQIPGHVIAVVPTADRTKATVRVRVALDAKDPRILPEMGARVGFLADAKPDDARTSQGMIVPSGATIASGEQNVLFVVRDGRVERRTVKLGSRPAEGQVILSGLSSGETVVVSGLEKLTDGAKVQIEK